MLNKKDKKRLKKVLESLDWNITNEDKNMIEIETYSNAGEDLIETLDSNDIVGSAFNIYNNYDAEEHIQLWAEYSLNHEKGIPDIFTLVEDAKDIEEMYKELYLALDKEFNK